MQITYYVNTMVLLAGTHTRVLCDPWVTFDRQAPNDLYNFPETRLSRSDVVSIEPDFIYITHTHLDHFDATTLELFDRHTPILISHYERNFTEREIRRLGFTDIRVTKAGEWLPLNGDDVCWIEPGEVYKQVDSVGVFRIDNETAINFNDNPFSERQSRRLRDIAGQIDVAMIPFAAHGPYPMFFQNLNDQEKTAIAEQRRLNSYKSFAAYINSLHPRFVLPFAGGLVTGSHKALCYMYSGIGRRSEAVLHARQLGLSFEPLFLSEGCSYNTDTSEQTGEYIEKTHASEHEYLASVAKLPTKFDPGGQFYIAETERIDLTQALIGAVKRQMDWKHRLSYTTTSSYFFDFGEPELYRVSLAFGEVSRIQRNSIADEVYEIFIMPYSLAVGLLTRHYIWSNVKTQYVDYFRKGDMDTEMLMLMNYLHI